MHIITSIFLLLLVRMLFVSQFVVSNAHYFCALGLICTLFISIRYQYLIITTEYQTAEKIFFVLVQKFRCSLQHENHICVLEKSYNREFAILELILN